MVSYRGGADVAGHTDDIRAKLKKTSEAFERWFSEQRLSLDKEFGLAAWRASEEEQVEPSLVGLVRRLTLVEEDVKALRLQQVFGGPEPEAITRLEAVDEISESQYAAIFTTSKTGARIMAMPPLELRERVIVDILGGVKDRDIYSFYSPVHHELYNPSHNLNLTTIPWRQIYLKLLLNLYDFLRNSLDIFLLAFHLLDV